MEGLRDHEPISPEAAEPDAGDEVDGLALAGATFGAIAGLGPGFLAAVSLSVRGVSPRVFELAAGATWVEVPYFRLGVKVAMAFLLYVTLVTALTAAGWWTGSSLNRIRRGKRNPGRGAGVVDSGREA